MPVIKSLEELNRARENFLATRHSKPGAENVQVIVSMGSCGVAVGAQETLQSFLYCIQRENLTDISVTQTGCIGLCEKEPIVQVIVGDQPRVIYGHVDERIARKIIEQHIRNGQPVAENMIHVSSSVFGS